METDLWRIVLGQGPIVAVANHDGHALREEVSAVIALSDAERLREEDPFTAEWTAVADTSLVPRRSRFEVDLNRAREEAVYMGPETAWGLQVWKREPTPGLVGRSLAEYDAYYAEVHRLLSEVAARHRHFVALDLHSYNYRRNPDRAPADPESNPEVNIGTGTMDRNKWARVVDRFIKDLKEFDYLGRHLDVRENVKFVGRQFPKYVHEHFPDSGCVLAVEFKKFFMDEWTGELDARSHRAIRGALASAVKGLREELEGFDAASG